MNPRWMSLRTDWHGSVNDAFEALLCQIASADETVPSGSRFFRVKAPDAGVECYWVTPTGEEWGWQAKFFSTMSEPQWRQLTKSFQTALDKHPQLVKFIVAIPLDRQDPRTGQKFFMDRWNSWVQKRQGEATIQGRTIQIDYFGDHEIMAALSLEKHRGRNRFFFGLEDSLGPAWFRSHLKDITLVAGERYTPTCHVDLPIVDHFHSLGRTPEFDMRLSSLLMNTARSLSETARNTATTPVSELLQSTEVAISRYLSVGDDVLRGGIDPLPLQELQDISAHCIQQVDEVTQTLRRLDEDEKSLKSQIGSKPKSNGEGGDHSPSRGRNFSSQRHYLNRSRQQLYELHDFLYVSDAELANGSVLLLVGEPGSGKTHLLCDVAQERICAGYPTVMAFGVRFQADRRPITQLIQQLDLDFSNEHEFLGALEAVAQAAGRPAMIVIDALNESPAWRFLWRTYLAELIADVRAHPWVRLALSVRTSYLKPLLAGVPQDNFVQIDHLGFSGREYEATLAYFTNYGIEISTPPLTEEFSNPLFLKLYCEGLRKRRLRRPPDGVQGFSAILEFYLDSVNTIISDRLGLDEGRKAVQKAVQLLAREMAKTKSRALGVSCARQLVERIHRAERDDQSLFYALLMEGVIAKDAVYRPLHEQSSIFDSIHDSDVPKDDEIVKFEYDRFTDHFIAVAMIGQRPEGKDPATLEGFLGSPAGQFLLDHDAIINDPGIVIALAIQVPELFGFEIIEGIKCEAEHRRDLVWATVVSIMWRHPDSISNVTRSVIEESRTQEGIDGEVAVASILLSISCHPEHPLNGDYLHELLSRQKMPERDRWWSTALHRRYIREKGSIHRLLDWALYHGHAIDVDDRTIILWATSLAWMLSTPDRILRDRATKALVALLDGRPKICNTLIERFIAVDDPYIRERVFAAAYGCALRNRDHKAVRELAVFVYKKFFQNPDMPAHLLLRDYARGIIEVAVNLDVELPFDPFEVEPPYFSPKPQPAMNQDALIAKYGLEPPIDWKQEWVSAYDAAWSLITTSDFATYQINSLVNKFERTRNQDRSRYNECRAWIFLRMLDLGWKPELFREFDREVMLTRQYDRHNIAKPETMLKKYAWIALHELAGHLTDNELLNDYVSPIGRFFSGPWELNSRDTDPSILYEGNDSGWRTHPHSWWFPEGTYNSWELDVSDMYWVKDSSCLPDVPRLLRVKDPDGNSWLLLDGTFDWDQYTGPVDVSEDGQKHRKVFLIIQSYVVKKKDASQVFSWLEEQNFFNRWMPEAPSGMGETFLGEFPWHASTWEGYDEHESEWTQGDSGHRIPKPVVVTSHRYFWEQGYDGSLRKAGIYMRVPAPWLINNMELQWLKPSADAVPEKNPQLKVIQSEAAWLGPDGKIVAHDPSVIRDGPSVLLIREDAIVKFLKSGGYELLWTVLGEKQILGTKPDSTPGRMIINGAYRQMRGKWSGTLRGRYEGWE